MSRPYDEVQTLRYLHWQDAYKEEKPYQLFMNIPRGRSSVETTNCIFESGTPGLISNIRGQEDQFNLDDHGFAMIDHETSVSKDSFDSAEDIEQKYLPEVEALIRKELPDVYKVVFFDWRLRKSEQINQADMADKMQRLPPSPVVHNDISPSGALSRVMENTGEEAAELLKGRVRIINTWRPTKEPVEDWPLCVCDGSTVASSDVIECDHVRKDRQSSMHFLLQNHGQKWYYRHFQTRNEAIFIKTFDSSHQVRAKMCPHTSFKHLNIRPNAPPRESIEVRALVFSPLD